jgi:hypothetical protein
MREKINFHSEQKERVGCNRATFLIVKSEHARLGLRERLHLVMHRVHCKGCRRFRRQMKQIKDLLSEAFWNPDKKLSTERKQSIIQSLRKTS